MIVMVTGTIILALAYDAQGTATLLVSTLSAGGITWITKKITERIDMDASLIISFAGWSIAGVSMVKIISNALGSLGKVQLFFTNVSLALDKVVMLVDKITFWN